MDVITSPLEHYSSELRVRHATLVSEHFERLVERSGVNPEENARLVSEIETLQQSYASERSARNRWRFAFVAVIVAAIALLVIEFVQGGIFHLAAIPVAALVFFAVKKIVPKVKLLNDTLTEVGQQRDAKISEAWAQMAPLNALHSWEVAPRLFRETFPDIEFDRYLTVDRLTDLQTNFGLWHDFNEGRSILGTQSGEYRGNPFALVRYVQHWIGERTYYGSIVIFWIEQMQDDDGNWVDVEQSQTLTAAVDKPFPEFAGRTNLLFGHEAAPNLSFVRTPSNLSGADEGFINTWRKNSAIRSVERKARREVKRGTGDFTVMANTDFEVLFGATERDHEVEFRLLFSPLAQQEMVKFLGDRLIGFGDNFIFQKQGRLNFVEASHMDLIDFSGTTEIFMSYDLTQARRFFAEFHAAHFRAVYFSFAPLLTIPLYTDKRSSNVPPPAPTNPTLSTWECESLANAFGEDVFRHPESVTQNLLRTSTRPNPDGSADVAVRAFGYAAVEQVDFVPVLGGDGNVHQVPVPWVEYVPVANDSTMTVWPAQDVSFDGDDEGFSQRLEQGLRARGVDPQNVLIRRGMAAIVN